MECFVDNFKNCENAKYENCNIYIIDMAEEKKINTSTTYYIEGIKNNKCVLTFEDNNYFIFVNMKGLQETESSSLSARYQNNIMKYWDSPEEYESWHRYTCLYPLDFDIEFFGPGFDRNLEYCK